MENFYLKNEKVSIGKINRIGNEILNGNDEKNVFILYLIFFNRKIRQKSG